MSGKKPITPMQQMLLRQMFEGPMSRSVNNEVSSSDDDSSDEDTPMNRIRKTTDAIMNEKIIKIKKEVKEINKLIKKHT
jgi:hypothetical protein